MASKRRLFSLIFLIKFLVYLQHLALTQTASKMKRFFFREYSIIKRSVAFLRYLVIASLFEQGDYV